MDKVKFDLLVDLSIELGGNDSIGATIATLAMDEIPMSDTVIELGKVIGVLPLDYKNPGTEEK